MTARRFAQDGITYEVVTRPLAEGAPAKVTIEPILVDGRLVKPAAKARGWFEIHEYDLKEKVIR